MLPKFSFSAPEISNECFSVFHLKNGKQLYCSTPLKGRAVFSDGELDLLTGQRTSFNTYEKIERRLDAFKTMSLIEESDSYRVFHLFYELGEILKNIADESFVSSSNLLWIELEYQNGRYVEVQAEHRALEITSLSAPTMADYRKKFERGREKLLSGDCYQFNLTYQFSSLVKGGGNAWQALCANLFSNSNGLAPYAHLTHIPMLKKLFISNSPECLFQAEKKSSHINCWSMPVKGTIEMKSAADFENSWRQLTNSKKDQAELYMITDLLRNDLTQIELSDVRVLSLKKPLIAPGLLHQYSLLATKLSSRVSLWRVLRALFPGGSVTGAPKKRVLQILKKLEGRPRGLYCGSSVLMRKNRTSASINIRSGEFNIETGELCVGAGGGITLESECKAEFQEMYDKYESFMRLLR